MRQLTFISISIICLFLMQGFTSFPSYKKKENLKEVQSPFLNSLFNDPQGIEESITIPLKRVGNLLLLEAKVDSTIGNFVFDTGAPGLVLNKTYFRDAQKVYNSGEAGISGISDNHYRKKINKLSISDLYFERINADVTELGHLENKKGVKILGLIGASFLKDFEAIIDLKKYTLQLYLVDKKGERISKKAFHREFKEKYKLQFANNVICIKANIGSKPVSFCLDTGAESNVLDISCSNEILETVTITKRVEVRGASTQVAEVFYGIMNEFEMDSLRLNKMNVLLTDLSYLRQVYGINIQGMLGYDFFEKGLISINIRKKELGILLHKEGLQ